MNRVSLPGFSAERSICSEHGTFNTTSFGLYDFAGADVKPKFHVAGAIQPQTPAAGKECFTCRSSCLIRWRNNTILRNRCLDSCPCDF
jgi:hypothetical protein